MLCFPLVKRSSRPTPAAGEVAPSQSRSRTPRRGSHRTRWWHGSRRPPPPPRAALFPLLDDGSLGHAVAPADRRRRPGGPGATAPPGCSPRPARAAAGTRGPPAPACDGCRQPTRSAPTEPTPTQVAPTSTPSETTSSMCRPAAGSLRRICRWAGSSARVEPHTPMVTTSRPSALSRTTSLPVAGSRCGAVGAAVPVRSGREPSGLFPALGHQTGAALRRLGAVTDGEHAAVIDAGEVGRRPARRARCSARRAPPGPCWPWSRWPAPAARRRAPRRR